MNKKYRIVLALVLLGGIGALAAWYLRRVSVPVLEPRGVVAAKERHLIIVALSLSLIVVIPVFVMLFGFAWRYREDNPKRSLYSPELNHSRIAETIWWLVPSALILILSVITWNSSHELDPYRPLSSNVKPLTIQVVALDWKWLFIYPDQHVASVNVVHIPLDTPVDFQITSDTVMNSFWLPSLGGQIYAMPGMSTQLHLMASQAGNYYGSSANISGSGFAGMHFTAVASPRDQFAAWLFQTQHAPNHLTPAAYTTLARPSKDNPPNVYASAESGLYDTIVDKYMMPQMASMQGQHKGNNSAMEMSANMMPGMEMQ